MAARTVIAARRVAPRAGLAPAARELLVLASELGEVRAGAGTVFEEAGFADPEVHDTALVHEIVGDPLDETRVRLRMLVSALRCLQLSGAVIYVIVALRGAVDAIGPV